MRDPLDDLIDRYFEILPSIRRDHGSVWAIVAGGALVETFADFSSAAKYVDDHFGSEEPVLIRHSDETPVFVPFVHVMTE